jgi:hypothetical protein
MEQKLKNWEIGKDLFLTRPEGSFSIKCVVQDGVITQFTDEDQTLTEEDGRHLIKMGIKHNYIFPTNDVSKISIVRWIDGKDDIVDFYHYDLDGEGITDGNFFRTISTDKLFNLK